MNWWYTDTNKYGSLVYNRLLDPWAAKVNTVNFEIHENESGITLNMDLPGAKSSDLLVESVSGDVKITGKQKGKDFLYNYRLPKNYDPLSGSARLEDGVLTLVFNKLETAKPKAYKIPIK
jgi:HSP20 family molecular chaperone IbpA